MGSSDAGVPDWSSLAHDGLELIAGRLDSPIDFVRFGAVCRSWHAAAPNKCYSRNRRLPYLLLTDLSVAQRLYCPSDGKSREVHLNGKIVGRGFTGAGFGWLVQQHGKKIQLVNPFLDRKVNLPDTHYATIWKICLSSRLALPADSKNFFAVALHLLTPSMSKPYSSPRVSVARLGDENWTTVVNHSRPWNYYFDAVCFKGDLYVVDAYGNVDKLKLPIENESPQLQPFALGPKNSDLPCRPYIVDCDGMLLLVLRVLSDKDKVRKGREVWSIARSPGRRTVGFHVYRLVCDGDIGDHRWEILTSLQDRTLVIGLSNSVSLDASSTEGCQKNSIYFSDDGVECRGMYRNNDVGIYNMTNGDILPIAGSGCTKPSYSLPIWVTSFIWLSYSGSDAIPQSLEMSLLSV